MLNRRQFLGVLTAGRAAVNLTALGTMLTRAAAAGAFMPLLNGRSREMHAIARLTFGITPALYQDVRRLGADAFVAQQLAPQALSDSELDVLLEPLLSILNENGGVLAERYDNERQVVAGALLGSTVLRAVFSQRQLYERMVEFCGDHVHVYLRKGSVLFLKIDDDRDVVRPHALGAFRALLGASARSPAMLVYLDNAQSEKSHPNQNYSRELLELHTLGVGGGYTEDDVREVARCFTGWSVDRNRDGDNRAVYVFRPRLHDDNPKTVLGVSIAPNGEAEGEQVFDLLAAHPSTARFISTKLARRFAADAPSDALVNALTETYTTTGGDLHAMLTRLFAHEDFWNAPPRFKRPLDYVYSVLRALNYRVNDFQQFIRGLRDPLEALGQLPFTWPAPNGYPDVGGYWLANLLPRWQIAQAAASGQIPGATADTEGILALLEANGIPFEVDPLLIFMGEYLLGRPLTNDEAQIVTTFAHESSAETEAAIAAGITLLLASPAFQYR